MDIHLIPAFNDNYIYLLREDAGDASVASTGVARTGVVDPGDPQPVIDALEQRGWQLTHIFNTHHHPDHIGGNSVLKERYGAEVIGARADVMRIPDMETCLGDGETISFGRHTAKVLFIPGHTSGHIAFYFAEEKALFCGDTLFALGCGRLFEGTPADMWTSLLKLRDLPDDTQVYCGHEYTQSNARFAVTVDPQNGQLRDRVIEINDLRARGLPTIPTTIGLERATNPFLRADEADVVAAIGLPNGDPVDIFTEIRRRKDHF